MSRYNSDIYILRKCTKIKFLKHNNRIIDIVSYRYCRRENINA